MSKTKALSLSARLGWMIAVVLTVLLALAALGWLGSRGASASLESTLSQMSVLRSSMQADMMHDALRADVLLALRLGRPESKGNDQLKEEFKKDLADHLKSFRDSLAIIKATSNPKILEVVAKVEPLINRYLASADAISAEAILDARQGESGYDAFMQDFSTLEGGMASLGDVIEQEAAAAAELSKSSGVATQVNLAAAALVGLLVALISVFLVRRRIRPLKDYSSQFAQAATGDLTVQLKPGYQDEVGQVASSLNRFMGSLIGGLGQIKTSSDALGQTADAVRQDASRTVEAVAAMEGHSALVAQRFAGLVDQITATEADARAVAGFVSGLAGQVSEQAQAVASSSASVEQAGGAIDRITQLSELKEAAASQLAEEARLGERTMGKTVESIAKASKQAEGIIGLIASIEEIAARTNLLAMNAAIEAAHAGNAGRGFAVVASEIRKLAESSSSSAQTIATSLQSIIGLIKESRVTTEETGATFSGMVGKIGDVTGGMREIRDATRELSSFSRENIESLVVLNQITGTVRGGAGQADDKIRGISTAMQRLKDLASATRTNLDALNDGLRVVAEAARTFQAAGERNAEVLQDLETVVGSYRL